MLSIKKVNLLLLVFMLIIVNIGFCVPPPPMDIDSLKVKDSKNVSLTYDENVALGVHYINMSDYRKAERYLSRAISQDTSKALPYRLLGMVYETLHDTRSALTVWEKYKDLCEEANCEEADRHIRHLRRRM